jgi:hypothetical protein
MTCTQCGHEQVEGKFCAKCGSPLTAASETPQVETVAPAQPTPPAQPAAPVTPNQNVEQVKAVAKNYVGSFVDLLKKPNSASTKDDLFVNGIISFVILNLLLGLATTGLINKFYTETLGNVVGIFGGGLMDEVENILGVKYIFIFALVYAILGAVTIAVVFFANKLFVEERSFKTVAISMTNFYPAAIVVSVVTYLLTLVGALKFGFYILILAVTIVLTLAPLFVIGRLMENKATKFDKFYIYVIVCVVILILSYFVTDIALSQIFESIFNPDDLVDDIMDEMW